MKKAFAEWAFDRQSFAYVLRRDHVVCLGDSHMWRLRGIHVPGVRFRVRAVGGATASGIQNRQSKTHALTEFNARLGRARRWQQILLHLGEVDCGFVIWYRAEHHGLSVDEQLTRTLDSYTTFIARVASMGFRRVMVLSVPLPTIGDLPSERMGEVANLRKEVTATKAERTELTLRFNSELRERCDALGVTFVDATTGQLDPRTGLIHPRFVRKTHLDHHLERVPYIELVSSELGRLWSNRRSKTNAAGPAAQ
jgi:hypothetical protein